MKTTRQVRSNSTKTKAKPASSPLRLVFFSDTEKGKLMAKSAALLKEDDIPRIVSTKKIRLEQLKKITPLTAAQEQVFEQYKAGNNLILHGMAGTGKTFCAIYLAMKEILSRESDYEKLVVIRSATPVKDLGFLPGSVEEKIDVYQQPYRAIFNELFPTTESPIEKLIEQKLYEFVPTSFIRGITLHKAIIIMDEFSSSTYHELDSVITRLGGDCKIIFCGDKSQTDLIKKDDIAGVGKFMQILKHIPEFRGIEFYEDDCVRSELVKSYLITKKNMGYE